MAPATPPPFVGDRERPVLAAVAPAGHLQSVPAGTRRERAAGPRRRVRPVRTRVARRRRPARHQSEHRSDPAGRRGARRYAAGAARRRLASHRRRAAALRRSGATPAVLSLHRWAHPAHRRKRSRAPDPPASRVVRPLRARRRPLSRRARCRDARRDRRPHTCWPGGSRSAGRSTTSTGRSTAARCRSPSFAAPSGARSSPTTPNAIAAGCTST